MSFTVRSPVEMFFDAEGNALSYGNLYIGEADQNPKSNPIPVYWDADLTQPAEQPIQTLNGRPAFQGEITNIYIGSPAYSLITENGFGAQIQYESRIESSSASVFYNAKDFGAVCDGTTDDTVAILDAVAFVEALPQSATLYIPGTPLISGAIDFSGTFNLLMEGGNVDAGFRVNDSSLLEPITFGLASTYTGRVEGFNITRPSYDGATENVGMAFYDAAGCTFIDCDTRFSKYPALFYLGPVGDRVAYNTFVNFKATGGFRNISVRQFPDGTGFANENVFIGGRCFTTADTETNIYLDQNVNQWRFYSMSLEGAGDQSVYVGGTTPGGAHSIVFDQCRTEGTWVNDDIVLESGTTLRCEVRGWNLYTTVTFDEGDNHLIQTATQNFVGIAGGLVSAQRLFREGVGTDVPLLDLEDAASSGNSYGLRYVASRGAGYLMRLFRDATELVQWSILDASQALLTNLGRGIFRRTTSARADPVLQVRCESTTSGDSNVMELRAGRGTGTAIGFTNDSSDADQGGVELVGNAVQFRSAVSTFAVSPLRMGNYYFWVDDSDRLRIKNGAPTSQTDGVVVGTQV